VLTDIDLSAMVEHHLDRGAQATLALTEVSDPSSFGLVQTAEDGCVQAFLEKPSGPVRERAQVNAGAYVFEPKVLDRVPDGRRVSVEREVFPALVADGALYGFPFRGYWTDTGTPVQYLQAQLDLVAGRRPGPPAPGAHQIQPGVWALGDPELDPTANVRPPVLLGAGAQVAGGATAGSSVIGAGAVVQEGASVEESVLLTGAVVGPAARVRRSILGPGATVGEGADVSEMTVVGAGVAVEAGAVLVGARLPDGDPEP
jgi:mannose-1-phosphate guanylyltransferase